MSGFLPLSSDWSIKGLVHIFSIDKPVFNKIISLRISSKLKIHLVYDKTLTKKTKIIIIKLPIHLLIINALIFPSIIHAGLWRVIPSVGTENITLG